MLIKRSDIKMLYRFLIHKFKVWLIRVSYKFISYNIFSWLAERLSKRYVIFVLYEPNHVVQDYKYLLLDSLKLISSKILIVVNAEISKSDINKLNRYGKLIIRDNIGYDSTAYQVGVLAAFKDGLKYYTELLFVNDTIIGPFINWKDIFKIMRLKKVDFWGLTKGKSQSDFTNINPNGYIPEHLQSYFLSINCSLVNDLKFKSYWQYFPCINSRNEAVGLFETVFTKYWSDLGYSYSSLVELEHSSDIYNKPLSLLKKGLPIIKFNSLFNYNDEQFAWNEVDYKSEVPELLKYIKFHTTFPVDLVENIVLGLKKADLDKTNEVIIVIDLKSQIHLNDIKYIIKRVKKIGLKPVFVDVKDLYPMKFKFCVAIIIFYIYSESIILWLENLALNRDKMIVNIDKECEISTALDSIRIV